MPIVTPISELLNGASHRTLKPIRRIRDVFLSNWYLGFTSFGGPPVHFRIFHDKFVDKLGWVDEQMYQELFALCQAFSGPGSTKMHYCLNLLHDGFFAAVVAFMIWSLPGSLGMYGLAVGIFKVNEVLPRAVYGLLSGLNAATVGIIALAAVQLAQKAITDRLTRILVILGACAGMLYNALWYFPVLMAIAGISTIILDFRILHKPIIKVSNILRGIHGVDEPIEMNALERELARPPTENAPSHSTPATAQGERSELPVSVDQTTEEGRLEPRVIPEERKIRMSWQFGAVIIAGFFVTFIIIMVLRGTLRHPPLLFNFFANMYLAGTIIFGGGPVVIPLLREYVVVEGWVSPRDFLIGLAIIQAFPGPNFAFAVYLGSLTALSAGYSGALGAFLGFVGIFMPGLILVHGTLGLWQTLRSHRWVKSLLRGINAGAVGLIYTAVYRLWQIGYVDVGFTAGTSLGNDPWWVVITVVSYCGGYWFHLNAPSAIILGAVMGLIRYGVISH